MFLYARSRDHGAYAKMWYNACFWRYLLSPPSRECILDHRKGLGFWETLKAPRPPPSNTRTYGDRWPFSVWAPVKISTGSAPVYVCMCIYVYMCMCMYVCVCVCTVVSMLTLLQITNICINLNSNLSSQSGQGNFSAFVEK